MTNGSNLPRIINSISELHRELGLSKPLHPLVSLVNYADIAADTTEIAKGMVLNFYKVSYKLHFSGKVRYGQGHYDFDEGGLSFIAPKQLISAIDQEGDYSGYTLLFHPDFLIGQPLGRKIQKYDFFSYTSSEALYLSEKEKGVIIGIFKIIDTELHTSIDHFSQEVILAQIDLLLTYSKRFYNRQFITRQSAGNPLLTRFEDLLTAYFADEEGLAHGLPSVQYFADQLTVSPHYLSDMLRTVTGQNTQQHIHTRLITYARDLLSTTELSVAEIAYRLGFEHPQSFSKLFRTKTKLSPLDFRQSFRQK